MAKFCWLQMGFKSSALLGGDLMLSGSTLQTAGGQLTTRENWRPLEARLEVEPGTSVTAVPVVDFPAPSMEASYRCGCLQLLA